MVDVIADIQGFKKTFNEFVLKELAVSAMEKDQNGELLHKTIIVSEPFPRSELPYKYRKVNTWLTENYHGIEWSFDGGYDFADIPRLLHDTLNGVKRIFVKGLEKKQWLRELIGQSNPIIINNLEDFGCPKLDELVNMGQCWHHQALNKDCSPIKYHCAMNNVIHLKQWYTNYLAGSLQKSLKIFCDVGDLTFMTAEQIAHLPKFFLAEFARTSIEEAWDKLPENFQKDPEIMGYRRCREHWKSAAGDQVDGLAPFVKDCSLCQFFLQ